MKSAAPGIEEEARPARRPVSSVGFVALDKDGACSQSVEITALPADPPADPLRLAQHLYQARKLRNELFADNADLFGEPAWDMMLDLFIASQKRQRVNVSSACLAGVAPHATSLRWLGSLERRGFVIRDPDPSDRRRVYVRLSGRGIDMMRRLLGSISADYKRRVGGAEATS